MEWLNRLFDITKLPSKFFVWVSALTAAYLFSPGSFQGKLHIDSLPVEYKSYAGIAFIASSTFLSINILIWAWTKIKKWCAVRTRGVRTLEAIAQLDFSEKVILREFYIQVRHVIELPLDHPTVAGLVLKRILLRCGREGYASLAGRVYPFTLAPAARSLLKPEYVDLPLNPTEQEKISVEKERPNFIPEIERHDQLRGGNVNWQ